MSYSGTIDIPGEGAVAWRACGALETLVAQVHAEVASAIVGIIGDAHHVGEGRPTFDPTTGHHLSGTEHLPDINGLVRAGDFMHSPIFDAAAFGLALAASQDPRIDYMEFENLPTWPGRKMQCSKSTRWLPQPVATSSAGPHCHVSINGLLALANDGRPFQITATAPPPPPAPRETDMQIILIDDGHTHAGNVQPYVELDGNRLVAWWCKPFIADPAKVTDLDIGGHPVGQVWTMHAAADAIAPTAAHNGITAVFADKLTGTASLAPGCKTIS